MKLWLIAVVALCLCQTGQSQDRNYEWSLVAMGATQALDIHSSVGGYELNPVLGRGPFGKRQVGIKAGVVVGWQIAQWLIVRRWPETRRAATYVNYAATVGTGAVAWRNYTQ